jgi:hypothetical protein
MSSSLGGEQEAKSVPTWSGVMLISARIRENVQVCYGYRVKLGVKVVDVCRGGRDDELLVGFGRLTRAVFIPNIHSSVKE